MAPTRTIDELEAQAMLLGMDYDHTDHTFYSVDLVGTDNRVTVVIDADTLEVIYDSSGSKERRKYLGTGDGAYGKEWTRRCKMVCAGLIGPVYTRGANDK